MEFVTTRFAERSVASTPNYRGLGLPDVLVNHKATEESGLLGMMLSCWVVSDVAKNVVTSSSSVKMS